MPSCGDLPLEWKAANVSPVLKKGDSRVPSNYRPISVLPVLAKVLEKCAHQQVYTYMQNHQLLHPAQFGFRPGHSTQDAVLACIEDWRRSLDDDKLVGVAFIDLSKAFDSINHKLLLQKLESYGFGDREMRWFYSYLAGRKQRVVIEGSHSSWSNVTRGVPQGSILGPLLFMIFVNDLPAMVEQGTAVMYADDTTLYQCSSDAIGLQEKLTAGLVKIANWLCQNKLSMNVQKTQLLLLSRKRRAKDLENIQIVLNCEVIKKQDCVKYLGVLIDSSLSWEKHISRTRKKCYSGLSQLRRLGSIPPNLKKQLYNSLVLPHLDYCSVVWHCFSHTIDHVGDNFDTPVLYDFGTTWVSLFSHSPKARLLWRARTGQAMRSYSQTQWWSRWEVYWQLMNLFGDVLPFLEENPDLAPATRRKLLGILQDSPKNSKLQLELAAVIGAGEPFVKATYTLEGDGALVFGCFDVLASLAVGIRTAHFPNLTAVSTRLSAGNPARSQQFEQYGCLCPTGSRLLSHQVQSRSQ